MPPTSPRFRLSLLLAGAVMVGVLSALLVRTLLSSSSANRAVLPPASAGPAPSKAADIAAFLAAERRMLLGTWVVHANFVRATATGRELDSRLRRAQRPPDTLDESSTSAGGRRNGRLFSCAQGPTGDLVCKDGGAAPAFADQVNTELGNLRSYLVAALPLYRVVAAPGAGPGQCWRFLLAAPGYPSPPYGSQALFCFDVATGAPSYSQIVRPQATDTTTAVVISATVTDADLTVDTSVAGAGR